MRTFIKGLSSCAALCLMMISVTHAELPDVALDYTAHPPLALLRSFDVAVVDPDAVGVDPSATHERDHQLFAYVSLGELAGSRHYDAAFPAAWLRERNPAWDSRRIDQTAPGWSDDAIEHIMAPLWQRGFRGFFLDTLDAYNSPRLKWTRQSRQFFTEFKLSPRLHAQRNGAAPLSATASCCRPYLSTIFAPPPLASAYTLSGVR